MRIIGGTYRGKKLLTPSGAEVRPTGERAREALFSILYSKFGSLENRRVLDVFAGTGAFGLEAVSRGALSATFVDINPQLVKKNIKLFPAEQQKLFAVQADALKLPFARSNYNLLFMDAPYAKGLTTVTLQNLIEKNWLEDGCICLLETRKDEVLDLPECMKALDERIYGIAKVGIYIFIK